MLSFVLRLTQEFELEHGFYPNLLYLNRFHAEHLKAAFDLDYTMAQILEILDMELIIQDDITHPRVVWSQIAQRASGF
jgi:hypothetical protein